MDDMLSFFTPKPPLLSAMPSCVMTGLIIALMSSALAGPIQSRPPFVIAPMVEAFGYCPLGLNSANEGDAISLCEHQKNLGVDYLKAALDDMEPGGANGKVVLGYTVGVNLMNLPPSSGLDPMTRLTQALKTIKRPLVLYLMANQFAHPPSTKEFKATSFAKFADQTVPNEHYFEGGINPFTLDMNPALDVNRVRFGALQQVGKWYAGLPESSRKRIHAITLAGELHHFFPGFSTGMGRFDDIRVTDYGPGSVKAFQDWLRGRYGNIAAVNKKLQSSYASFNLVLPPSRDIRKEKLNSIDQHFDGYAHGLLPIEGWLANLPTGHTIKVYLNGRLLGAAEYGLNRQDVYEAVAAIPSAQVGFRYWLDHSALERGTYTVQVLVEGAKTFEIARRTITIMGSSQAAVAKSFTNTLSTAQPPAGFQFSIDHPKNLQSYFFNPLAREWSSFRSGQVTLAYQNWVDRAVASGLPGDKLFSHQIAPATIGSWNPLLFGADESLQGSHNYKKGINAYGGSASVSLLKRHYLHEGEAFGVPEFHTQAWKDPEAAYKVLQDFQAGGASFVSPYFISMKPAKIRGNGNAHDKFRIAPENSAYGSDYLYRAIIKLSAK